MKKLLLILLTVVWSSGVYAVKCDGPNPSTSPDSKVLLTWTAPPVITAYDVARYFVSCLPQSTPKGPEWYNQNNVITSVSASYTSASSTITEFGTKYCRIWYTTTGGNSPSDVSNEVSYTCQAVATPPVVPVAVPVFDAVVVP